jgi:L-aminopeptidase/D-esterase-like protein
MTRSMATVAVIFGALALVSPLSGQQPKPRARDLGVPFQGTPGPLNSITDVAGIEVGYTTLISGEGQRVEGTGPVRTGVTAIHPRGKGSFDPVMAGYYSQNGNGEMTGTIWIEEAGLLEGPVMITNTHSVGIVRDAVIEWERKQGRDFGFMLPVVAETSDRGLNDMNGFHVKKEHAFAALDNARGGRIAEGNVGGGTGMHCNGFKGGTGTASRQLTAEQGGYVVGAFVQCNQGSRTTARIAGVPLIELTGAQPCYTRRTDPPQTGNLPLCGSASNEQVADMRRPDDGEDEHWGSIIVVIATDAPLMPHQLKRLARRVSLGMGRLGATAGNGSGDIFIAFSTANGAAETAHGGGMSSGVSDVQMLQNSRIGAVFVATIEATEEAVVNSMIAAETIEGADYRRSYAIPHDDLRALLKRYGRLNELKPTR